MNMNLQGIKRFVWAGAGAAAMLLAGAAMAASHSVKVTLSGASEVPPVAWIFSRIAEYCSGRVATATKA